MREPEDPRNRLHSLTAQERYTLHRPLIESVFTITQQFQTPERTAKTPYTEGLHLVFFISVIDNTDSFIVIIIQGPCRRGRVTIVYIGFILYFKF